MKHFVIILRWLGVLPASIAAYLLPVWSTYYLLNSFFNISNQWIEMLFGLLVSFMGGGSFVVAGAKVSPKPMYSSITSIVLMILLIITVSILLGMVLFVKYDVQDKVYYIISFAASIAGAIIGCFSELQEFMIYLKKKNVTKK